ncbi:MAG: hypothetical protein Q9187_004219, partial [Circinaria calcarea]
MTVRRAHWNKHCFDSEDIHSNILKTTLNVYLIPLLVQRLQSKQPLRPAQQQLLALKPDLQPLPDTAAKVPMVDTYLADIAAKNAAGASPRIAGGFVVYDLPDRDCAAESSNGEYSIANNGVANYKAYIDAIKVQILKYPTTKCANAEAAYKTGVTYAIKQLNLPNVSMYLDAGHAGWLGWSANIGPAANLFGDLYKSAGSPAAVRGLATNVANYNAFSIAICPAYTQGNTNCDEKRYINALAPLLTAVGFPAHFIMDTCAGFGIRPTTATGDPLVDAFMWVKPGGESDGTSNPSVPRYDSHCGLAEALKPAPQAGTWFG